MKDAASMREVGIEDQKIFVSPKTGGRYTITSYKADDREQVLTFFRGLSQESLRKRFLASGDGASLASILVEGGNTRLHLAWSEDEDERKVVGVCDYSLISHDKKELPEVCLTVSDQNQREGIGYKLALYTAKKLKEAGYDNFYVMIEDNKASEGLYRMLGAQLGDTEEIREPERSLIIHMLDCEP